jgi:hypothetical protein
MKFLMKTSETKNCNVQCAIDNNLSATHVFIKGTVARDFRPSVFFINQSHLSH